MANKNTFNELIKQRRISLGLSRKDAASLLQWSESKLQRRESNEGNISINEAVVFCIMYDIDIQRIIKHLQNVGYEKLNKNFEKCTLSGEARIKFAKSLNIEIQKCKEESACDNEATLAP